MKLKSLLASFALLCSGSAFAETIVTVDFDSLGVPTTLNTQFADLGVVFNVATVTNANFGGQVVVPSGANYVAFGDGFTITFVDPTNSAVAAVTDGVALANLGAHSLAQYDGYTVSVRDLAGAELASATVAPVNSGSEVVPFNTVFPVTGIHSLVFTRLTNPNGAGIVGFDTLRFLPVTAVPVPAALFLFAPALGVLAMRRRRA